MNDDMTAARRQPDAGRCVRFDIRTGRWLAEVDAGGKTKHLGHFNTRAQARAAYQAAAAKNPNGATS